MGYIFVLISIAAIALYILMRNKVSVRRGNVQRSPDTLQIKMNDKMIIINDAVYADIRKAILQFCDKYRNDQQMPPISLAKINNTTSAIYFLYDIDFYSLCFLINYLHYPENILYKADIKAWASISLHEVWSTAQKENQRVMLYIPPEEKEYDNVYLTTSDGTGAKIEFNSISDNKRMSEPPVLYQNAAITVDEIMKLPGEELK
jgi:hypothetical protein